MSSKGQLGQLTANEARRVNTWIDHGKSGTCGQKTRKTDTAACAQIAGSGTDHIGYGPCRKHGGLSPTGIRSASRERAYQQVAEMKRAARFYGGIIEITAEQALQEEVGRCVGVVRFIESKLSGWGDATTLALDPTTGLPPLLDIREGFRSIIVADTEHAAWLRLYQVERTMLVRASKACIDAGIAQKLVGIWTHQADTMYKIVMLACERMGIPTDQLPQIMPNVIREVTQAGEVKELAG